MTTDWMNYIKPELLVLIPALYFFGMFLKHSEVKDKFIPSILGAGGVVLAALYVVATMDAYTPQALAMGIFVAVVQGVLCAGMSVYGNQLVKQHKKEE